MGEVVYGIVFGKPKIEGNELDRLVDDVMRQTVIPTDHLHTAYKPATVFRFQDDKLIAEAIDLGLPCDTEPTDEASH